MSSQFDSLRPYAQQALLVVASMAFSLCFACATPLVAFATLAALTMPRRQALSLIAVIWVINQAIGYGMLDYPTTTSSFQWGAVLGVAALCATLTAAKLSSRFSTRSWQFYAVPFIAAFAVYQLVMLVAALFIGGMEGMAPEIVAWAATVDAMAFAGLCAANRLVAGIAPASALRFAHRA